MTREEEIRRLAQHLANVWYAGANFNLEALFEQAVQWADEHPKSPWISVEDRLPEEGKCVFVRYGDVTHSLYSSAYMIEKNLWSIEGYGNGEVTHWMSISQIEKEEVQ